MSDDRSRNRWWRFVPRSRAVGALAVVAWIVVLVLTVVALALGVYTRPPEIGLQIVIAVLAAWCLLRSITGLAALNRP
jgi:uncharacterized membrane protein